MLLKSTKSFIQSQDFNTQLVSYIAMAFKYQGNISIPYIYIFTMHETGIEDIVGSQCMTWHVTDNVVVSSDPIREEERKGEADTESVWMLWTGY